MASHDMGAVARRLAPSLVVVETPGRVAAGFVVGPRRVLTCIHPVAGESPLLMRLPDASSWITEDAFAADGARDLLALPINAPELVPLRPPADGTTLDPSLSLYTLQSPGSAQSVVPVRVAQLHTLAHGRVVAELDRALPESASGAPLVLADGTVVGVVAAGVSDGGPMSLAIPLRADDPLLTGVDRQPLERLWRLLARQSPERVVQDHPVQLLDGCPPDGVRALREALVEAIGLGAPTYNRGDFDGCARIYQDTARRLLHERADCPAVLTLLAEGLQRAGEHPDSDGRAWAMRDCFDGLLSVVQRWLEAHPQGTGKVWLN